ncbi:MAG: HIT family protein [Mycoplasma sp.]|nr:HIT family protein [Mycoplasma sp.]
MDSIFKKIIDKESPAKILFENKRVIAFYDINPKTPGHFLVIPKKYSRNLIHIKDKDMNYLFRISRKLALKEIKKLGVDGFRLIVNNEASSKQVVFHTHVHIIPSEKVSKDN